MKKLSAVLALLFVSVCGYAQISGSSSRPLTVQNNGTSAGTVTGQRVLNFVSGCTATLTSGVFNITCSSGGSTVNGGSNIAVPNFQNGTGGNIINFVAAGSNIQASIPTDTVTNSMLQNNGTTVGGANCVLGASCTPTLDAIGSPQTNTNVSFTASAGYGYTFLGTAPASTSSGTGTAPGTLFNITAPAGGATTGSATTAGAGGSIGQTAGAGGSGAGGTNASGGAGGNVSLIPGVGGAASGSGSVGANGVVQFGTPGTVSGTTSMAGATSGNAICTPPAVAGTTSNPVVCSNAHSFPGVTSNVANVINVKAPPYNAVGDAQYIADATSSSSTGVVTSATANFQSTDVGKKIYCTRSDTNTAVFSPAITTIASYQSATQVTASVNGGATLSNNMCVWATQDDTSAITAAVTAAKSATAAYDPAIGAHPTTVPQAQTVYIPQGGYLVTGYIYQFLGTATGQVCPSLIGGDWSKTTIYIPGSGFTANSSGYGSVIDFDNCSGFRLGNFTINGLESKPGSLVGGQDNVRINNANRFTVENLEIQNLGGTNGANLDVENSQAGILRNVWIQGSSVAGHTAYQAYYSGDSFILTEGFTFSNPNSGQSLFITTSNGGAPISGHLSFVGGVVDECTNTTACTEITSSYVDFSDMTIWAGHQQTKGALYVTGNSQLRANSISVGEYNASISQIGMQIDSGSTVYLAESIIWGGGSSTVAMVNNGNFVDVGGNIFENCPSGSCTIATSAQMNSGTGSYFGTGSITGVAQTSGNLVLTSGWGSGAAAGTISGNTKLQQFTLTAAGTPGASPVLTVTFPSPYYVAPICTLTQTAGTNFTDITLPISSSVGATGVTWTFTGTPVAAHTYTFVESCDIS